MAMDPGRVVGALRWRYAVQVFDRTRRIAPDVWRAIEEAMVLTPSSYGLQPWRFLVVESPVVRERLLGASWNQMQVTDASHLVVFARKRGVVPADVDRWIDRVREMRPDVVEADLEGYRASILRSIRSPGTLPGGSMESYTRGQAYIALGCFLAACAMMGVDTCPMEGFDPAAYDRILGLDGSDFTSTVVGAAGYRDPSDETARWVKVRFDAAEVIRRVSETSSV